MYQLGDADANSKRLCCADAICHMGLYECDGDALGNTMTKRHRIVGTLFLVSFFIFTARVVAAADNPLDLHVDKFTVRQASIIYALRVLRTSVAEHMLLFGLEVAPYTDEPERNLTFSLERSTVREILDEIIRQDPQYQYEVIDEQLIHMFPRRAKDDPTDLLNVRVDRFQVSGVGYEELIQYLPHHVPELQLEMLRRAKAGGVVASILSSYGVPEVTLELENVTVRDILNRVAQETEQFRGMEFGPTGWLYTFRIDETVPLGGHPHWNLF